MRHTEVKGQASASKNMLGKSRNVLHAEQRCPLSPDSVPPVVTSCSLRKFKLFFRILLIVLIIFVFKAYKEYKAISLGNLGDGPTGMFGNYNPLRQDDTEENTNNNNVNGTSSNNGNYKPFSGKGTPVGGN